MQVVIFDLDHTLIHCDSFAGFMRHLLLRDWWRLTLMLLLSPAIALLAASGRTRVAALSMLVWCGTLFLEEDELHQLMDRHVTARFTYECTLVCRGAVQALKAHQACAARVVIATGSADWLAERVCRNIGVKNVEIVGSTLRPWGGGFVAERHCYGTRKVEMLIERGIGERLTCVYTDSATDLPLLEAGICCHLVNPTAGDRAKVEAVLGGEVQIIEWR